MAKNRGREASWFDTVVQGGDIVIHSPMSVDEAKSKAGDLRSGPVDKFPAPGLGRRPGSLREVVNSPWRYPGNAGKGIFAQSATAVLGRSHVLGEEFEARSRSL